MDKMLKKFIAVLLVITLAGANLSILGMYGVTYALSDEELAEQTTTTENSNVEFNAYFEGGGHTKTEKIDSTSAKLFVNIKVKNAGYLKNGSISLENTNFKIGNISNDNVESVDKENNKILLKQLSNGSDVTIEIPISALEADQVSADYFAKETKTLFAGTYVDGNGKEKSVSKEIINKLSWNGTAEGLVEAELTKYIPYATGEKYGVMLQIKINSGAQDSALPIKKTEISVSVPEINGVKPSSVNVIANHTKATNGKIDGLEFTSDNYEYDTQNSIVKINEVNSSTEVAWLKDVKDEYLVNFIFEGQEIYTYANKNGVDTKITTSAQLELYNDIETIVDVKAVETEIKATDKLGTMADFDIEVSKQISKGQVYSNYTSSVKKETEYSVKYTSTVNSANLTDSIEFTQSVDKFLEEDDSEYLTTVLNNNYVYNKTIKINQNVFKKILGEGAIDICDSDKNIIGTIDSESEVEDGYYVLDISKEDNNELYIVTSKPIAEGQLVVEIEKAIKTNIDYDKNQFIDFTKIEANLKGEAITSTVDAMAQILLKEPTSVADIAVSKTDLTTVVENENVEIRATLDTSNLYNALYTDPTLKIKLPSYIERVNIENYDVVMANGLTMVGEPEVITEAGAQVIYIELTGTNKEYTIDAEYKGTIVVLDTDLTAQTLTPTNTNKITMEFTNKNSVSVNSNGTVETELNFVAPTGIVAANGISNYAEEKEDIFSISDENVTGEISAYSEKKVATVYGKIVNNYENAIDSIVVLGRIPVKDNKKIDTTESMGSTFSTVLNSEITVTGIDSTKYTVYYSENVDATTDVSLATNGWSTTKTNGAKSYMIVTDEYEMPAGEIIDFSYEVEIPENLKHNNNVYEMYKIYYNNLSSIGEIAESKVSSIVGLTTGAGPELKVELKSTAETVREGQIVKMKVIVENTGSMTANNVKVNVPLPEYTTFMEYVQGNGFYEEETTTKTIEMGTVEIGKKKEVSYYIKIDEFIEIEPKVEDANWLTEGDINIINEALAYPKEIWSKVTIVADELTGKISSNEHIFNVQQGQITITIDSEANESQVIKAGEILTFVVNLENISGEEELTNTVVTIPLNDGTSYKSAVIKESETAIESSTEGISYDETSNTVKINVGTLQYSKIIIFSIEVEEIEGTISVMAKATADDVEEHYSNVMEYMSDIITLEVSELTSTPRYVKEGNEITYSLKITNNSEATVRFLTIVNSLPKELTFVKATYEYAGEEKTVTVLEDEKVQIVLNRLEAGESKTIKIIAKAGLLPDKNDLEIQNNVTVSANNLDTITTNTVTNIIEYNYELHQKLEEQEGNTNPEDPSDPSDPINPTETRYKITGTAWIDSNKNGKRDTDEQILAGVPIMLLNKDDNTVVKDVDTNEEKRTFTNEQGKYEFSNLQKGEYIVIFLYDASRYSLTTYREENVDEAFNSDVINININVDGNRTIAGTTDVIEITNENARDIDIGLYVSEKFDLKLDKYISKINLTTPTSGTITYNYDKEQLAKVEILGQNVGKSTVAIEYKIVVTNEGAVPGYVKKIVDYLPEGASFNTELNKDWYLSENGNVYNASLSNELIQPGESKEVTLILTEKITEDRLGTPLNNNAEIYESYNEQGLQDIDSTVANKVQDEDDMSNADLITSIVTGKIIMYTTITFGVIAILGFAILGIKKKVLNKRKI